MTVLRSLAWMPNLCAVSGGPILNDLSERGEPLHFEFP
jgi:hypothetical protein